MLSIANVKIPCPAAKLLQRRDDYYSSKKEKAPSQWQGELAKELGLEGPVRGEDVNPILDGHLPDGQHIHVDGGKRPRGIDLTLNAPKSVSIQALAVGDGRLLKAHEHAVSMAMRHAETLRKTRNRETTGKLLIG